MSTSKPISTISYNSEAFLRATLENLIKGHTISDYYFIPHQADTDDLKDHIHVWVQPNRSLDPMTLQEAFKEIDPNDLEHPLGCISFRPSKLDDWMLYGLHLQPYLEAKGLSRNIHYSASDIRFHNEDEFRYNLNHALCESNFVLQARALDMVFEQNVNPAAVIRSGQIPFAQASQLKSLIQMNKDYELQERIRTHESTVHSTEDQTSSH